MITWRIWFRPNISPCSTSCSWNQELMQLWASVELWLACLWSAIEHICFLWDNFSLQDSNLIQAAAPISWIGSWQNIFKWVVKIQGDLTLVFSCSEKSSYPKLAGGFSCSPVCRQVPFRLFLPTGSSAPCFPYLLRLCHGTWPCSPWQDKQWLDRFQRTCPPTLTSQSAILGDQDEHKRFWER